MVHSKNYIFNSQPKFKLVKNGQMLVRLIRRTNAFFPPAPSHSSPPVYVPPQPKPVSSFWLGLAGIGLQIFENVIGMERTVGQVVGMISGNPSQSIISMRGGGGGNGGFFSPSATGDSLLCDMLRRSGLNAYLLGLVGCVQSTTSGNSTGTATPQPQSLTGGCKEDPSCGTRCTCEPILGADIENPPLPGTPMVNVTRTCRFKKRARFGVNCQYECELSGVGNNFKTQKQLEKQGGC
jgi:hypothetical protein